MRTSHAIQVQGLTKSYKDLHVLRGVDFEVAPGGIFALLGSNGAGKTTVVKILATLLKADAGTAGVNGFDLATQPADVRKSISLTGQFAAVDGILTGRENLLLAARLWHLKDPGAIADDLLRRFSLTEAGGRKVSTYSGGMRRRLGAAGGGRAGRVDPGRGALARPHPRDHALEAGATRRPAPGGDRRHDGRQPGRIRPDRRYFDRCGYLQARS
ncbi:ATP-binding cassette domain-containing protein [Nonomuraea sp. NPDC050556]|uniref:ATP-binding cassette domain-containing protein n=1 Tax=Nonomuraea sp. NPDC050556 TaxID=3364369 RepID=UPI0037BB8BF1